MIPMKWSKDYPVNKLSESMLAKLMTNNTIWPTRPIIIVPKFTTGYGRQQKIPLSSLEQLFAAPCWQVLNLTNKREEEEGEQWIFLFRGIVW